MRKSQELDPALGSPELQTAESLLVPAGVAEAENWTTAEASSLHAPPVSHSPPPSSDHVSAATSALHDPAFAPPEGAQSSPPSPLAGEEANTGLPNVTEFAPENASASGWTQLLLALMAALLFGLFLVATALYVKRKNVGKTKAPVAEKQPDIRDVAELTIRDLFAASTHQERLGLLEYLPQHEPEVEQFFATNPQLADVKYIRHQQSPTGGSQCFCIVSLSEPEVQGVAVVKTSPDGGRLLHWPSFQQNVSKSFRDFIATKPAETMHAKVFLRRVHGLGKNDYLAAIAEFPGVTPEFRVDLSHGRPEDLENVKKISWSQTMQVSLELRWIKNEQGEDQLIGGALFPNW